MKWIIELWMDMDNRDVDEKNKLLFGKQIFFLGGESEIEISQNHWNNPIANNSDIMNVTAKKKITLYF